MRTERQTNPVMGLDFGSYVNFRDKSQAVQVYTTTILRSTQSMFKYDGLPDTIPARNFEMLVQTKGFGAFIEHGNGFYVLYSGLGGEPNPYFMPTTAIISNPALKLNKEYTIDKDCVIIPNDSYYMGLLPMVNRYASLLAEIDITIRMASINARTQTHISANDDRTKASADLYLHDLEDGKLSVIGETGFMDVSSLKAFSADNGTGGRISQLIELRQYIIASLYNYIGLNANYNMKRESITASEVELNADALFPMADDMLNTRRIALEKINKMFGLNITVRYNSSWRDKTEEMTLNNKLIKTQIENAGENEAETDDANT